MSLISEKLLEQARAKARAAKRNATATIGGKTYKLEFDARQWFYCVTDENGEWLMNINSKSAPEAKRFLANWLSN
jgi:hypothetical protein